MTRQEELLLRSFQLDLHLRLTGQADRVFNLFLTDRSPRSHGLQGATGFRGMAFDR